MSHPLRAACPAIAPTLGRQTQTLLLTNLPMTPPLCFASSGGRHRLGSPMPHGNYPSQGGAPLNRGVPTSTRTIGGRRSHRVRLAGVLDLMGAGEMTR